MGDSVTVLIVDDDPLVRITFVRILEHGGFRPIPAEDGVEGLAAFRASPPDIVLLDLRMPRLDGLDVLSAMVAERPETPVIVVSGEGTMRDAVEALRRGAWDFVVKPMFDPELLIRSLERALEKASLRRQNQEYRVHLEHANRVLARALGELREDQQGARALQFQLLPRDGLAMGAYTGFRRLFPSQLLSGDFVDYFPLGDRFAGFYVADVSGHGAASAFVTAMLTTLMGKYRQELERKGDETVLDPAALLRRLDADLRALTPEKHVTMFYGVFDAAGGRLRYANAGLFPFPLVRDGDAVFELECPGRPLGLPGSGAAGAGEVAFGQEGRLLAMTDGVLELGLLGDDKPQRDKREELRFMFQRSEGLEALVAGLGLDGKASLRDDVALLYLQGRGNGRGSHA